jgi:hypothetical protein
MAQNRNYRVLVAAFAAVLYLALIICASGIIGLLTDREVLVETDAGPLVAPIMVGVAVLALVVQLLWAGRRVSRPATSILFISLLIGVVVYFLYVVSGSVLYAFGSGDPLRGVIFLAANLLTPFTVSIGILAAIVAVAYLALMTYRDRGGASRTPRWPWENADREDREDLP